MQTSEIETKPGVTARAVTLGVGLCFMIGVASPYAVYVMKSTDMTLTSNTPAAVFLYFLWIGVVQVVLGAIHWRLSLSRGELLTIFIMMIVATAIPTRGLGSTLLGMMSGAIYYATAENNWAEALLPHMPRWMTPQSEAAVKWFYEGLPQGTSVPWEIWVWPLASWLVFMVGFWSVTICAMVILRRQWVDHEHLIYPWAQLPLAMIEEGPGRSLVRPFFRRPLMWVGLLFTLGWASYDALGHYLPFLSPLPRSIGRMTFFRDSVSIGLPLNFMMLGFAYFLKTDVMCGLWGFYLLQKLEVGVFSLVGLDGSREQLSSFSGGQGLDVLMGHQTMGAMIALVLLGLWTARRHLSSVFLRALRGGPSVEDDDEIMSYRAAVFGLVGGLGVMGGWLWKAGLPLWVVPIFLAGAVIIFVSLTRLLVESGLPTAVPRLIPADFVISGVGASHVGASGMVALCSTMVWAGSPMIFMMAPMAYALKLSGEIGPRKRRLLAAIALAIGAAVLATIPTTMLLAYQYGGLNLHSHYFMHYPTLPWRYATQKIAENAGPNGYGWAVTGLGAALMAGTTALRRCYLWWPLHPLGLIVAADWIMNHCWFAIFTGWLIKGAILRYGGLGAYRSARPLFHGLILGQFVAGGLWLIIDYFTGMVGNEVYVR
jgi:hypothetical protein